MRPDHSSPSTAHPWWVALICGMASYIDSAAIVSSGTALVLYQHSIGITEGQIGVLSATLTLSIAVGALTGGRLGDRYGRRRVFLTTMAMIVIGSALLVLAPGFAMLMVGMMLVGLGSGADLPVSLASISEAASDHNRGRLVGFSQILWFGGIIGANVFGIIAGGLGQLGGQIMFCHVGIVALIVLAARLSIPESTTWANADRERLAGSDTIRASSTGLKDVLSQKIFLMPLLALIGFYTLTNIGANTGGQFGTYIGVNVVGITVQQQSLLGIVMLGVGMLGAMVFMRIVDTPLRMKVYAVGAVLLAGSYLIPVVFGFSLIPWVALSFFNAIGGAFAFEAIMKVWSQESFPTLLRSTVQGSVIGIARVLAAGVALITPALMNTPTMAYLLLTIIVTVGLVCGWVGFRRTGFDAFAEETLDASALSAPAAASVGDTNPGAHSGAGTRTRTDRRRPPRPAAPHAVRHAQLSPTTPYAATER